MHQKSHSLLFLSHLDLVHHYIKNFLCTHKNPVCIDATCGHGHDSLVLAENALPRGNLTCFDIQPVALESTKKRLESHLEKPSLEKIHYLLTSHENLHLNITQADLIVYNLGFLPRGNKTLTTMTESTLLSVKNALSILNPFGLLLLTCYPGHAEGALEEASLLDFSKTLDPRLFMVCHHKWTNRKLSPSLLMIQKIT